MEQESQNIEETVATPEYKGTVNIPEALLILAIRNSSQDTIYFKDKNSRFIWNSLAHVRQFGLKSPEEMVGKTDGDFFPPEFFERTRAEEKRIIETGEPLISRIESWVDPQGKEHWFSAYKYPLYGMNGNIIGTWGTSRDITALKEAEAELARKNKMLKRLARIDELSGLYNRRYFYETLKKNEALFSRRNDDVTHTFSLITLDVDHFKTINDTFGHAKGDELIRHISDIMLMNCRSSDIVFRIGGDEFSVVLPDTDRNSAMAQAERIRTRIERTPIILGGNPMRLTVSLGVACFSEHGSIEEMIHVADERLYLSKRMGRNRAN
jgi:diguanylate cyclase (GGDEF)-like protein/PAS domain S-box-containing protein